MNHFDFRSHVDQIYATFPEAHHRPLIGLTANHSDLDATLRDRYYKQIVAAGGTPVIIPPVADKEVIVNTLEQLDGLILTGGADYNPLWMGEEPSTHLHGINRERDLAELLTARLAFNRQIPTLGICRGIQTLAIALGGKVAQDIQEAASPGTVIIKHAQDADRSEPTHSVRIADGSILSGIYEGETIHVNSFHHQAVAQPGPHFRITATAPDGTVEAIESTEHKAVMGVQWHPEWLEEEGRRLFKWLVDCAGNFHVAKELHKRVLTLDTHCDTPMFFPQGVQFDRRDPRILVDLHKMTEGRQDAVTMVAYLPQPKIGETFSSKIDLKGIRDHNPELLARYPGLGEETPRITPTQYADLIFDKIESIVQKNSRYLSIARTPADLYNDKRNGRKSIMLGIENGLAIERELANLKHFAQRGVVYITLCHNGDNDICDSARGCNTHDGVSSFGEKVIREMNDLGIMVDLSHGGEKSFYDALDISRVPIVCSHSNCKALCDVPRNLTDDQLRALAAKGGVAHTTLYSGFLRKDGEASVLDAVDHLEHAIRIMGIDHVGIGTDFDGDGGVRGMADSSELINFTIRLLRRKYSERDIEKIWGGNWLRVMAQVQNNRKA
ncbi:membrane dipeptidase [Segatella buccae]|uniref:membrane dipeptidase n=1 Tax=Segatella buccae TaxID=28126 RepID=UPI0022E61D95|nr:membrane dipeptidase [Segatella buccae]